MSSWQGAILNLILSYVAKPSISRGRKKLPITEVRKRMLQLDQRWIPWPKDIISNEFELSHSRLLHYRLEKSNITTQNCLFYIRGGGFCFKTPNSHARFIRDVMKNCNLDAYIPDYRLAPEFPFPSPLEDVVEAYRKLIELRPNAHIVLMGDSAGGNLATALLLEIKRLQLPMPIASVLLSPALDLVLLGDVEKTLAADDPLFTIESLLRLRGAYLNGANPMQPKVSPLVGELDLLPPIMVIAGVRELLLQDAKQLEQKVKLAGGEIEALFYADMPHVFPLFDKLPEAKQARQNIYRFIKAKLTN
ncbi:MAG: alpha/beta hydrolase [Parashewanella sp.]